MTGQFKKKIKQKLLTYSILRIDVHILFLFSIKKIFII